MASPLVDRIKHLALAQPTRVAVRDERGQMTYAELASRALAASHALSSAACHPKDGPREHVSREASFVGKRVALFAAPGADWVASFFGVALAGGVAVPLSPQYPEVELAWFLEDAGVDTVVTSRDLEPRARAMAHGRRVLLSEELSRETGRHDISDQLPSDATALLLYTSGTTGKPKGAMITHANVAIQAEILREAWAVSGADELLHALPLHHLHGLGISLMTALLAGATAHMLPKFDAHKVWDSFSSSTLWMAVPTMYQKLFEAFDAADPETQSRWAKSACGLRLATSGSAALPVTLAERWRAITGAIPLERFGMTEIGVGMTNSLAPEARRAGSVGKPPKTVEWRIVDSTGDDARPENGVTHGELWIRGPSLFKGYWGRDEATRAAFSEAGGWFKTGDVAERTDDGYVRLLGRTSVDILKSGGYKLSALEIEEALRENEAILEVAVVGLPDETWGDRVVAVVVARPGREADCAPDALRSWAKERIASYKVPREVRLVTSLPRNPIGKVVKPELIKALLSGGLS